MVEHILLVVTTGCSIHTGASGYLLKDTPREKVIEAIRGTVGGHAFVDPAVAGKLLEQAASQQVQPSTKLTEKLTEREEPVASMLRRRPWLPKGVMICPCKYCTGSCDQHIIGV